MSAIDRQNILNNKVALENIQEYIGVSGMYFNGEYRFTKLKFVISMELTYLLLIDTYQTMKKN